MIEQQRTIGHIVPQEEEDTLQVLLALIDRQQIIEQEIQETEETLRAKKKNLAEIQDVRIPEILGSLGMKSFTLSDGKKISLVDHYYAHISKANAHAAFEWLRDNNRGGIIKRNLIIADPNCSEELIAQVSQLGVAVELDEKIHPSTLKAFVKEQMTEEGNEFPRQLFSASVITKSKIA